MKDNLVYDYVVAHNELAWHNTRRGTKGLQNKIKKLGNKLVERGLLTREQADELERAGE